MGISALFAGCFAFQKVGAVRERLSVLPILCPFAHLFFYYLLKNGRGSLPPRVTTNPHTRGQRGLGPPSSQVVCHIHNIHYKIPPSYIPGMNLHKCRSLASTYEPEKFDRYAAGPSKSIAGISSAGNRAGLKARGSGLKLKGDDC